MELDQLSFNFFDGRSEDTSCQTGEEAGTNMAGLICVCLAEHLGNHYMYGRMGGGREA